MRRALCLLILLGCGDDSATDSGTDSSTDGGADSGIEYQMHDEIRVEADDGSATLVIAANSLPVGVEASEIQVVAVTPPASDELDLVAYELTPDGTSFREPAELTVRRDWIATPIAVLESSDGSVESPLVNAADESAATLDAVSVELPHFSNLVLAAIRQAVVVAALLRDTHVGRLTEGLAFSMEFPETNGDVTRDGTTLFFSLESTGWQGFFNHSGLVRLNPVGDYLVGEGPLPLRWEPSYRCSSTGEMSVTYRLAFRAMFSVTIRTMAGDVIVEREMSGWEDDTVTATCRDALPGDSDESGTCSDSEGPTVTCSTFMPQVDIEESGLEQHPLTPELAIALFANTTYPCDEFGGGLRTVCRATPGEFAEGAMWVGTMLLGTDVPDNDSDHSYIYSLVFDSDEVPDNDWVPVDPFVWDYFQGTDRWYQLIWNHLTSSWSVTVTQVDATQTTTDVPSAVRVVIVQNAVTFFIPVTELASATPAYRFSAFIHDGSFSRTNRGGDVSGVDPTVPPQMFVP